MLEAEKPYYSLFKDNKKNPAFLTIGAPLLALAPFCLSFYLFLATYFIISFIF